MICNSPKINQLHFLLYFFLQNAYNVRRHEELEREFRFAELLIFLSGSVYVMCMITEEQDKRIKELYLAGKNDYQVAREVHLSRTTLREWRNRKKILSKTNKKGLSKNLCQDIIQRHDSMESFDSIAKFYGVTWSSIIRLLKRNDISYVSPKRKPPKDIQKYCMTNLQRSVLLGDMFGDGGLVRSSKKCAYFQCGHSLRQESFLKWKYNILKPLSCRTRTFVSHDKRRGRFYKSISMGTWSTPELGDQYRKFYPSGKGNKIPTPSMVEHMDLRALAVWYMGDGTKRRSGSFVVGKHIDAGSIVCALNRKFGDIFDIRDDKKCWSITVKNPQCFFKMVSPYILPSMKYKIPEKYQ